MYAQPGVFVRLITDKYDGEWGDLQKGKIGIVTGHNEANVRYVWFGDRAPEDDPTFIPDAPVVLPFYDYELEELHGIDFLEFIEWGTSVYK